MAKSHDITQGLACSQEDDSVESIEVQFPKVSWKHRSRDKVWKAKKKPCHEWRQLLSRK